MKVVKVAVAVVLLASGVAQAAIYELTNVPYGRPSASMDMPPIVGYVNGWFELNGPIKSGMEVAAFDVTFDNDVRGRIDSAHTHFDNDTALVTSTENFTSVYFINHAYDVGVVLSIGEGVEIDHGKVPVHVYGDGGNIASYADQYQEYRAYATVRPSTVAATPEPSTWALMITGVLAVGWKLRRLLRARR